MIGAAVTTGTGAAASAPDASTLGGLHVVVPARLPGPLADRWDWQSLAACRRADPSLFFAGDAERAGARRRREEAALAVCAGCPVQLECLAHAVQVHEPYGLWGGLSEGELHRRYEAAVAAG